MKKFKCIMAGKIMIQKAFKTYYIAQHRNYRATTQNLQYLELLREVLIKRKEMININSFRIF